MYYFTTIVIFEATTNSVEEFNAIVATTIVLLNSNEPQICS